MNDAITNPIVVILILLGAAGLVHAMMQLGVSVLTLLSGHSLGTKRSHDRLLDLNLGYIGGSFVTSLLLVAISIFFMNAVYFYVSFKVLMIAITILSIVSSLTIIRFYYRRSPGTLLWIPRGLADYLTERAKKTRNPFEAMALGGMTVAMELPFTIALYAIFGFFSFFISPDIRLWAALAYCFITVLPLTVITIMIGGGHRLSTIQRWRETNKRFMQYASSFGLLAIALFITLYFIKGWS